MYGTVDEVKRYLAGSWNPATGSPSTADVTAWLATWSTTADGEIGHLVSCPVDPSASPALYGLVTQVTVLRAAAQVYDRLYPPTTTQASTQRSSEDWRAEANRLMRGVQLGATADGETLDGVDSAGPLGDETGTPNFGIGDLY